MIRAKWGGPIPIIEWDMALRVARRGYTGPYTTPELEHTPIVCLGYASPLL